MKFDADEKLLKKLGLDVEVLDSGCCGMAGAFGFEKEHYDVSVKCGERVLLPEVRKAGKDTLIVADGFSCREQIRQTTDRKALHIAQVMKMAMKDGPRGPSGNFPEEKYVTPDAPIPSLGKTIAILGVAVLVVGAIAGLFSVPRHRR